MTEREALEAQVIEADPIPEYYSNAIRLVTNIYGTTIVFGRDRPIGIEGSATIAEPVCTVHMSPTHAKSLFLLLRYQLRDYEKKWGRLPVVPEMAEKYGEEVYG